MAELIYKNDYKEFDYTGNIQSIELLPGKYKLEVWGAEGGGRRLSRNSASGLGGLGGYATGILTLRKKTRLYIYVGGHGLSSTSGIASGGWNGGGSGYASGSGEPGNGGGGGTDIRISSSLYSRIIVAGGGGGGGEDTGDSYGHGGGTTGTANYYPGTQNSAGLNGGFGYGGNTGQGDGGGGGGGWYGGGTVTNSYGGDTQGGGGGSGYTYTASTVSYYPNPCELNESYYLESTDMNSGKRQGDGFAKITLLQNIYLNLHYGKGIENINISPEIYDVGDIVTLTPILKQGYLWNKWTGDIETEDLSLKVVIEGEDKIISLYANSKPGQAKYTVKHYIQNLDISSYTIKEIEELDGITDSSVSPSTKTYIGFTSPDAKTIIIKNDSSTILEYYYTRNKYKAEVISNGTTNKDEYYYEEKGNIVYDKKLNNKYVFTGWRSSYKTKIINNGFNVCEFYMPASDVKFYVTYILNRLNSNIYKNIFPEVVTDMEYINKIIDNTPTSTASIRQDNHNLQIGDVVYLDDDKLYKKALAENTNKSNVAGVVSKVNSSNVFTLMNTGKIDYQHLDYTDTSILYLSDKIPGKLVHYSNISNTIYVPVAIYADNKIIVNIQQGSVGDTLAPYEQEITNFETYDIQDLDDIINQTIGGVLNA